MRYSAKSIPELIADVISAGKLNVPVKNVVIRIDLIKYYILSQAPFIYLSSKEFYRLNIYGIWGFRKEDRGEK